MTIGPVQLLVIGFEHPDFQGEIIGELQRLTENDLIRVIDALAVHKDADGNVERLRGTDLSGEEQAQFGAMVGALVGLGMGGEEGMMDGAELGEAAVEQRGGIFDEENAWDVLADIPEDTAAALILVEHRWAIPFRDAVARAGGFRLAAEFISPLDLIALGLVAADEAEQLEAADAGAL
ncbi:hypothetical protein [Egicoccus sp. AB-alg2]|uniref:hypothetical protein n=1 Tax=Egicoccus sp. AB-alg2 TaxID=3242693 RepID=UPI00359E6311